MACGAPGNLAIEYSHPLIQRPQLLNEQRQHRASGFEYSGIRTLNRNDKLGDVEEALRSHKSKLRKMALYRIDPLGPLPNYQIANAEHHGRRLLLFALRRYEPHGRPLCSFMDLFSISRIVLLTLHKWLDVSRSD
ncbi:hypothetical protein X739_28110 [Mesorhizobium sp. LNHC220B00]|nr:hypothetical protein X739_28110 [Mesorhizobium sp. LNHC220B00]